MDLLLDRNLKRFLLTILLFSSACQEDENHSHLDNEHMHTDTYLHGQLPDHDGSGLGGCLGGGGHLGGGYVGTGAGVGMGSGVMREVRGRGRLDSPVATAGRSR